MRKEFYENLKVKSCVTFFDLQTLLLFASSDLASLVFYLPEDRRGDFESLIDVMRICSFKNLK